MVKVTDDGTKHPAGAAGPPETAGGEPFLVRVLATDRRVQKALVELLTAAGHVVTSASLAAPGEPSHDPPTEASVPSGHASASGSLTVVDLGPEDTDIGLDLIRRSRAMGATVLALGHSSALETAAKVAGAHRFLGRRDTAEGLLVMLDELLPDAGAWPGSGKTASRA